MASGYGKSWRLCMTGSESHHVRHRNVINARNLRRHEANVRVGTICNFGRVAYFLPVPACAHCRLATTCY